VLDEGRRGDTHPRGRELVLNEIADPDEPIFNRYGLSFVQGEMNRR
jgi:hypothetical protein